MQYFKTYDSPKGKLHITGFCRATYIKKYTVVRFVDERHICKKCKDGHDRLLARQNKGRTSTEVRPVLPFAFD